MKTGEMHAMAAFGSAIVAAALVVPTVWLTDARANTAPQLQYEVIEASLAYAPENAKKTKQPQKVKNTPPPEVKPDGVSRDEKKQVDEPKKDDKDKPKPTPEPADPLAKFKRTLDDEASTGGPETLPAFDGSKFGFGNVSKGDPYFQRLVADLEFTAPELARTGTLPPQGCVQLTPDGKIPQTKFKREGDGDLQALAEAALKRLKDKRNADPIPVPTHLLRALTVEFVCFEFKPASSD